MTTDPGPELSSLLPGWVCSNPSPVRCQCVGCARGTHETDDVSDGISSPCQTAAVAVWTQIGPQPLAMCELCSEGWATAREPLSPLCGTFNGSSRGVRERCRACDGLAPRSHPLSTTEAAARSVPSPPPASGPTSSETAEIDLRPENAAIARSARVFASIVAAETSPPPVIRLFPHPEPARACTAAAEEHVSATPPAGGVVLELLPGGNENKLFEKATAAVDTLLALIAKTNLDPETRMDRMLAITYGKRGIHLWMAGYAENGGLSFWDTLAMLGYAKALVDKLMVKAGEDDLED